MSIRTIIKNTGVGFFRLFGFEISLYQPTTSNAAQIGGILQRYNISLVLDVGANVGQYYGELRSLKYDKDVISFEPTSQAYTLLKEKHKGQKNWIIHQRAALGSYDGETNINVSGNSVSSSILPIEEKHVSAEPSSGYIRSESVPVQKLDTVLEKYEWSGKNIFLKIDTQGFEYEVLLGAEKTLPNCMFVQLEMSFQTLYVGQKTFFDLCEHMKQYDFRIFSIFREFLDPDSLESLQYNVVFMNNKKTQK